MTRLRAQLASRNIKRCFHVFCSSQPIPFSLPQIPLSILLNLRRAQQGSLSRGELTEQEPRQWRAFVEFLHRQ